VRELRYEMKSLIDCVVCLIIVCGTSFNLLRFRGILLLLIFYLLYHSKMHGFDSKSSAEDDGLGSGLDEHRRDIELDGMSPRNATATKLLFLLSFQFYSGLSSISITGS